MKFLGLIPWLLLLFAYGCKFRGPNLTLERAQFADSVIAVEATTATVESSIAEYSVEKDRRWYMLVYSPGSQDHVALSPTAVTEVPWENSLPASASTRHMLRVRTGAPNGVADGYWSAEILNADQNVRRWTTVRSWTWRNRVMPPFAATTNGRYLAILSPAFEVIDVKTLMPVVDSSVAQMFKTAARLRSSMAVEYTLSYNMNYLIVRFAGDGLRADDVPSVTGGALHAPTISASDPFARYALLISRSTGAFDAAIPTRFLSDGILSSSGLEGIDESDDGAVVLLYRHYMENGRSVEYTIRDRSFRVLYRTVMRDHLGRHDEDLTTGPRAAWDASQNRVLFYVTVPYFPKRRNGYMSVRCWDYRRELSEDLALDVAGAFHASHLHYVPNDVQEDATNE